MIILFGDNHVQNSCNWKKGGGGGGGDAPKYQPGIKKNCRSISTKKCHSNIMFFVDGTQKK